ncbi:hypothetical protein BVRB_8g184890 [Beta vulgaris subsp. vulgaris]|uniref:Uncharacterized protein n=2 Tax=Beta vulgaris subsp. vulgaris TaxID=3555 RepID=A0A0J8BW16_BETVV|nr:hypothetical protein BVRB_8g184890 [Beta vulgaris subsp. vulgaris]
METMETLPIDIITDISLKITCKTTSSLQKRMHGEGVLVNEKLHWADDIRLHDLTLLIVSFDLSTHSFGEVPGPVLVPLDDIDDVSSYMSINVGVLDGCLCILVNHRYVSEIMVMKEYGVVESWSKLLRVWKGESVNDIERTTAYTRSKKELLIRLVLHRFASINLEDMVIEGSIPIHDPSRQHDVHVCVENLLMLDCLSDLPESEQQGENTRKRRRMRRGRRRLAADNILDQLGD